MSIVAAAAVGARRADVAHPLHAVDRFFQRNGNGFLHRLRVGADIVGVHFHHRRRQRGIHGHGKIGNADGARQNDEQGANGGEDRAVNKEIDEQDELSFLKVSQNTGVDGVCPLFRARTYRCFLCSGWYTATWRAPASLVCAPLPVFCAPPPAP